MRQLKPRTLWKSFFELAKIPRLSGAESGARRWVRDWAATRGLGVHTDSIGNVVLQVKEDADQREPIILQAHLDMVGASRHGVSFDFEREGIRPRRYREWVRARGTSLGADNGIGVAAALTVAEERRDLWPLELLFTVEEERGCVGAKRLDTSLLEGTKLINLDSEEEALFVGCAGAEDCRIRIPFERNQSDGLSENVTLTVGELRGGHSGTGIHEPHSNAIQVLGRVLKHLIALKVDFGLVELSGGDGRNTIPSSSRAHIRIPTRTFAILQREVAAIKKQLGHELPEHDFRLDVDPTSSVVNPQFPLAAESSGRIIGAILDCPHGVLGMSPSLPDAVQTSSNLATVSTAEDFVALYTMSRSASDEDLARVVALIETLASGVRGAVEHLGGYPGWLPNLDSELLAGATRAFVNIRGERPLIKSVHAGLECGVIGARHGGLDMISIGPIIERPHTPDERVNIGSVEFFYQLLVETLKELRV